MSETIESYSTRIEGREISELFNHESKLPSRLWELTLWLSLLVAAGVVGFIYQDSLTEIFDVSSLDTSIFSDRIYFGLGTARLVFIARLIGLITGFLWRFFGRLMITNGI